MPEKRYTKVEEEVIQILDKMELVDERPARPPLRVVKPSRGQTIRARLRSFRGMVWASLAVTAVFTFLAVVLADRSHLLATVFAILAILAFLSPIVLRRPSGQGTAPTQFGTKEWRGRDISFAPPPQDSVTDRARRWWNQRRTDD